MGQAGSLGDGAQRPVEEKIEQRRRDALRDERVMSMCQTRGYEDGEWLMARMGFGKWMGFGGGGVA